MKKFRSTFITVIYWSLFVTISAQTSLIDSLEQVLTSDKLKNPEKAELLKELANAYVYVDTAKCRMYSKEALKLAKNNGYRKVEVEANIALANSYMTKEPEMHRDYALEALRLAQSYKLEKQEGRSHTAIGNYYLHTNQYYLAHSHYKKAEKIFLKFDDKQLLSILYNNLNLLYSIINDSENLKYYASKQLEIAIERGDQAMELRARRSLFTEKDSQQKIDFFLDLYQKSLTMNVNYTQNIALVCGTIYISMDLPHKALIYLRKALENAEAGVSIMNTSALYISLAEAYAMLNKIDSAEYFIKKVQDSPIVYEDTEKDIYRVTSLVEAAKGNYKKALEEYKTYHFHSDSVNINMKSAEIARIKNWHELEQKDIENENLQKEYLKQRKQTFILLISLILILALLSLVVFFYRKINYKNHQLNRKNFEITEKNCQLEELHATKDKLFSIVAHDLRSPISSLVTVLEMPNIHELDSKAQKKAFTDISKQVDDACRLLDNLLQWAKNQMQGIVPSPVCFDIQVESKIVSDLLQNVALSKKITLTNCIEKQNVYADRDMFLVILRNIVTNAIKFTSEGGDITINSEIEDNMLIISVKDTGKGISQELQDNLFKLSKTKSQLGTNNESGTGLGLVLCADFVKANGGKIWFESKIGQGTTFFFSVPLEH